MVATRVAVALTIVVLGCASGPGESRTADDAESEETQTEEQKESGGPSSWSEVAPNASSDQRPSRTSKKYAYIDVKSDAESHGPELTFRFTVDGVPIDGIFVAPGGRVTNFRIPAGIVTYENDECRAGGGGFEIQPGARITFACVMTTDGDCCEPRIEDEPKGEEGAAGEEKGKGQGEGE